MIDQVAHATRTVITLRHNRWLRLPREIRLFCVPAGPGCWCRMSGCSPCRGCRSPATSAAWAMAGTCFCSGPPPPAARRRRRTIALPPLLCQAVARRQRAVAGAERAQSPATRPERTPRTGEYGRLATGEAIAWPPAPSRRYTLLFQVMGVSASALIHRRANDNDTVASLSKRSAAGRARLACLEPRLGVGQVFVSRAPVEDLFESSDDPCGIGLAAAVAAGHEDQAEMASPAGCYRLMVQRR